MDKTIFNPVFKLEDLKELTIANLFTKDCIAIGPDSAAELADKTALGTEL